MGMQTSKTNSTPAKLPEHEATYRRMRDMMMFGDLAPGQKVTLQGITADLATGMTPVREAIRIAYGDDTYGEAFGGLDEDDLVEKASYVTRGVPTANLRRMSFTSSV